MHKHQTEQIADFVLDTPYQAIDTAVYELLKKHLLDSIGSLLYAAGKPVIEKLVKAIKACGDKGSCHAPGIQHISLSKAAQLYTAMIRYPDFMDNFLGKEATCHPSDNIGPLLAAAQVTPLSGKDFLAAMALAYAIECRLVTEIPVMIKGFDHTALLSYSSTAALARVLHLTRIQTAHALGIAGCTFNPIVSSRASYTYEWKGLASSMVTAGCTDIVLMAKEGITGPLHFFTGPKGFNEVFGMELEYDWKKEDFSQVKECCLKPYNAEVHTQSALEAAEELSRETPFPVTDVQEVNITTFLTCYHIVGGGAYGDRYDVRSKEQADHSMPYVMAALLLDKQLYPEQLLPERIQMDDVQQLLKKVKVHTGLPFHKPVKLAGALDPYTSAYPGLVPSKVEIVLADGRKLEKKKEDFHGFHTRPMQWEDVIGKFRRLSSGCITEEQQTRLIDQVQNLEMQDMSAFSRQLSELVTT